MSVTEYSPPFFLLLAPNSQTGKEDLTKHLRLRE